MADREIPWGSGLLNPPSYQNYGGRLDPTLVDEEEMNPHSYNVMANLNLPTSFSTDQVGVSSGGAGGDWEDTKRLARNNVSMEVFVDGLKEGRISEAELEQAIESGAELIRGRPRIIAVAALAKFRRDKGPRGYDLGGLVTPAGPGTFPQTASENMMAMGSAPPPDEFGNRTPVPSSDAQALIQALDEVRRSGTVGQIRGFLSSNMANLLTVASQDPDFANRLESIMESMPRGGDILRETGVEYGDPRLSNQDIRGLREVMEQLPSGAAGMPADRMNLFLRDQEPSPSLEPYDPLAGSPFVPPEDLPAMMPDWGGNKFAHGGYVGRGTMAGELGRRGDLSVREAGETMYERSKRLHGYDRGGYVHGRGTMPGELHPKGSLSVRVAGESMGEYKKHREDEDEHRPVRRTLSTALSPTLSRRMFS